MMKRFLSSFSQRGFALLSSFLLLILLLVAGAGSLLYATLELKSTVHYKTGNQALYAAESGVIDAMRAINTVGVIDFQKHVVNRWDTLFGLAVKAMPSDVNVKYQVTASADGNDPANRGALTVKGFAASQARRTIRVDLRKGNLAVPGAIYLANDQTDSTFSGNAFDVDGNDHDTNGEPGCTNDSGSQDTGSQDSGNQDNGSQDSASQDSGSQDSASQDSGSQDSGSQDSASQDSGSQDSASQDSGGEDNGDKANEEACQARAGIATRTESTHDHVVESLSEEQKDNVKGEGFDDDPLTPSVLHTGGPSPDDIDVIVANILNNPGVVTTSDNKLNGNTVFGTDQAPQITHLTYPGTVDLNGTATGAGILVVDGGLDIKGNLTFKGWIISRGTVRFTGNSTVLGSLWTPSIGITGGGNATVNFCSACLALADGAGGSATGNVPRTMQVVAWRDQ